MDNQTAPQIGHEKFLVLPSNYAARASKYMQPGEHIELSLRSWGLTHIEGSNTGIRGGFLAGTSKGKQMGHAWLIITNQRLMMISKGLISFQIKTFQFSNISSVVVEEGIMDDKFIVLAMGTREIWIFRKKVREYTQKAMIMLQNRISQKPYGSSGGGSDPLSELKLRLVRGEITQQQFDELKKSIQ
ncbi:MAG: PH domain-containing protein [Thermoplasmataceae archaeon]